ncbi:MAG: SpoIID/LytB domain-containing protein [Jatrophihabitans sp.]
MAAIVATTAVVVPLATVAQPAGASTLDVAPTAKILITMRGNGHGHGMSQYGARGAAIAGKSYSSILSFYYPGTTQVVLAWSLIRVRISGTGPFTTVAASSGLTVTGRSGILPTSGIAKYRLVPNSTTGLTLQQLPTGTATWRNYADGLPNRADFHRTNAPIRIFDGDNSGASSGYLGYVSAVRNRPSGSAGGVSTVNRISLDGYTAGVVPQEIPASWQTQAVYAQAVAARTYGRYAVEHALRGSEYDLCDTSSCQVYGGYARYDAQGRELYRDLHSVSSATSNRVLRYRGSTIFAQFAASNGGWTVAGGQPYLVTERDIYDTSRAGDPYLDYTRTVTARSVASYYGLATLTKIVVTTRDGNGAWGGRADTGYVQGTDNAGRKVTINTTGLGLQYALGIGTTWFSLTDA